MLHDVAFVRERLDWMDRENVWPDGLRYLWTDAFGVVLLISLYRATGDASYVDDAERLVADVERVLGRERGLRIGEAPDRDGQYYHYLAMWIYALTRLGTVRGGYRERALAVVREIHPAFVLPRRGVIWKMREDLSEPYPGYGLGGLDPFHGYVVYRLLDEEDLAEEIADMESIIADMGGDLRIEQDLGLGMMLWLSHFFPGAEWVRNQRRRSLATLANMWIDPPGYFCRQPGLDQARFAFTNAGIAIGLQAVGSWHDRVVRLNRYFRDYRSGDAYDTEAITHVMTCCAHLPGDLIQERAREEETS